MCQSEVTDPSSSPGLDSFEEPSTKDSKKRTRPPSASPMLWTSSTDPKGTPGLELLTQKWSSPTTATAMLLRSTLLEMLRGMSKVTSPAFAGWRVSWTLYASSGTGTTTRLVFWVEPDSDPF